MSYTRKLNTDQRAAIVAEWMRFNAAQAEWMRCNAAHSFTTGTVPIVLPSVEDVMQVIYCMDYESVLDGPTDVHRNMAQAVLDFIVSRVPVWVPVEPVDNQVERVAKAIHDADSESDTEQWTCEPDGVRETYRRLARAAMAVIA